MKLKKLLLSAGTVAMMAVAGSAWAEDITIATVNNNDMIVMQELAPKWEEATWQQDQLGRPGKSKRPASADHPGHLDQWRPVRHHVHRRL